MQNYKVEIKILYSIDKNNLYEQINEFILNGWKKVMGIMKIKDDEIYFQVMKKTKKEVK